MLWNALQYAQHFPSFLYKMLIQFPTPKERIISTQGCHFLHK